MSEDNDSQESENKDNESNEAHQSQDFVDGDGEQDEQVEREALTNTFHEIEQENIPEINESPPFPQPQTDEKTPSKPTEIVKEPEQLIIDRSATESQQKEESKSHKQSSQAKSAVSKSKMDSSAETKPKESNQSKAGAKATNNDSHPRKKSSLIAPSDFTASLDPTQISSIKAAEAHVDSHTRPKSAKMQPKVIE